MNKFFKSSNDDHMISSTKLIQVLKDLKTKKEVPKTLKSKVLEFLKPNVMDDKLPKFASKGKTTFHY